jgi:pyruvate formate lyase activating enzyme
LDSDRKKGHPLVIDVKGNSLDDGPGTRSVVFFKGCPLDCYWCQNPESKRVAAELSFDREKCVAGRECIKVCPEGALEPGNPLDVNRKRCTLCFECVPVCPSMALERVGREMSVEDIVKKVVPYKPFFKNTGGGVTLSGGEPTLFMDFASALVKRLKEEHVHTLVETCGRFDFHHFSEKILPHVDLIYMDMKIVDVREHKKWCGVGNEKILENFLRLHHMWQKGGVEIKPRTPLIPGITDTDDKMAALARFYEKHGIKRTALMKNNPTWLNKFEKIGVDSNIPQGSTMRDFYDQDRFIRIKEMFEENGIEVLES